jgi:hypothetical protein
MDVVELIARYPRLYHMAEDGSWPDIKAHGLLSTKALLDRFEVTPGKREALYSRHRPESVVISHAERGRAVIRDQKSMDDRGLERALGDDLTPREWYELLNDRVFFWLTEERRARLPESYARRPDLGRRHAHSGQCRPDYPVSDQQRMHQADAAAARTRHISTHRAVSIRAYGRQAGRSKRPSGGACGRLRRARHSAPRYSRRPAPKRHGDRASVRASATRINRATAAQPMEGSVPDPAPFDAHVWYGQTV